MGPRDGGGEKVNAMDGWILSGNIPFIAIMIITLKSLYRRMFHFLLNGLDGHNWMVQSLSTHENDMNE